MVFLTVFTILGNLFGVIYLLFHVMEEFLEGTYFDEGVKIKHLLFCIVLTPSVIAVSILVGVGYLAYCLHRLLGFVTVEQVSGLLNKKVF